VEADDDGEPRATLTSVEPWVRSAEPALAETTMSLLGWSAGDLAPDFPPAVAYAGARHLVLVARTIERLADLSYPFDAVQAVMLDADLTTIALMARIGPDRWRSRQPFAVGGVVEDPATGAAAAAFGAYLRDLGVIAAPAAFDIDQGVEMGRPSRLRVSIVPDDDRVRVSGSAVAIEEA
jgi:PhzF family phenazine biosynthesis protein